MLPKIVCIVGPTASGKTAVGIAVARAFDGEVIAADSRTVYRGMDIGTAKPERQRVTLASSSTSLTSLFGPPAFLVEDVVHWGFDVVNPDESFNAADFQAFADERIADILSRGKLPVIVGGTGLYIRALLDRPNYANVAPNPEMRLELEVMPTQALLDEIGERDPDALERLDEDNRVRLIRALEILRLSGKPLAAEQQWGEPLYDALQIGMDLEREKLYARIDLRVDEMVGYGLVDEVRKLKEKYGSESNAMSGIGYRQICDFFDGKVKLRDAVIRIKYDSHHYAKRQETWFKRDNRIQWVQTAMEALRAVESFIG
jgi:tRNA dimethylallyltransferase